MVDSINSNIDPKPADANNVSGGGNFYSGFNKPGEVRVNLANQNPIQDAGGQPLVNERPRESQEIPVSAPASSQPLPSFSDLNSVSPNVNHDAYNSTDSTTKERGIIFLLVGSFIFLILILVSTYFIIGYYNSKKIAEMENKLNDSKTELSSLQSEPSALELPAEVTIPPSSTGQNNENVATPVNNENSPSGETAPVATTPIQTPVVTPAPTTTPVGGNG